MICLDTSILIEYFRKSNKANSLLYKFSGEHSSFAVAIITKFEIYCGCNSEEQKIFWDTLFQEFTVLEFSGASNIEAVKIFQELKKKNQLTGIPDILIGATARAHGLKLATLNKKHFHRIENLHLI